MSDLRTWRALSYGYTPIWWLTVAGMPVVWTERATGLTLPTGFASAESATLVLDDAPLGVEQIDRDRGIGAGLPLGFKLLDSTALTHYLRRPTLIAELSADVAHDDTAINVVDNTGWPTSGVLYIGSEAITYSAKVGSTAFAVSARGAYGTLANTHKVGTTGQIVTDLPRYWAGRETRLYAAFADPGGHVCGTALAAQAVEVWRGRLEGMPSRDTDGWRFVGYSLDRVLDVALPATLTGRLSTQQALYPVQPDLQLKIIVLGYGSSGNLLWSYYVVFYPFAGYALGEPVTATEAQDAIAAAWDAKVTALGATELGTLLFADVPGDPANTSYTIPRLAIPNDSGLRRIETISVWPDGKEVYAKTTWGGTEPEDAAHELGFKANIFGTAKYSKKGQSKQTMPPAIIIVADGDGGEVPNAGMVRIEAGDKIGTYAYGNTATVGSDTALWPLELVSGEALEPQDLGDATATVIAEVSGNWDQTALTLLQSSGNGNRGDYDTLPASQGYALPDTAMDESSFARLAADPLGSLACLATTAESSIPDIYGGLMALGRLAVICQPQDASGTPVKLEVVSTAPGGQPVGTITDADLLAHAQEPVVSVQRAEAPNQVTLQPTPAGDDEVPPIVLNDRASQEALGVIAAEWRIPTQDREALLQSAAGLVAAQFASDQTAMAVVLRVHPGTPGRVGDGVWLELTHPALWTWATGEPGYSGPARVVGRTIEPDTCVTTMRLLLDGIVTAFPLSPSAVVLDFDDPDDPTWIEVPLAYLPHMLLALDNADNEFRLDVYRPGQTETIGNSYTIDAVAEVAGVCRLTVAGSTGIHTLVANSSHLTLPATANANQFQNRFAHADDGSSWG